MTTCDLCTKPCPRYNEIKNLAEGRMFAMKELAELCKKIENGTLVEVVRCKDCKYWDRTWTTHSGWHFCTMTGLQTATDWFCAGGERKGGDE